jgi:ATP-dependent Clp protease ATP-binding subunit ClpC
MEMALTSAAMTKVLSEGFDQEYGARPLRRAITSIVDDSLSEALLRGKILEGDVAVIDYDEKFDGTLAAAETNGGEARAVSENTFGGVSVTAVAGDPSQRGYDIAWTSVGMDLEGRPGEDLAGPANNVVKSTSAPVGVNDTVNN